MSLHIGAGKVTFSKNTPPDTFRPRKSMTKRRIGVSRKPMITIIKKKHLQQFSRRRQKIKELTEQLKKIKENILLLSNTNSNKQELELSHNEVLMNLNAIQQRQLTHPTTYPTGENELPSYSNRNNNTNSITSNNTEKIDNNNSRSGNRVSNSNGKTEPAAAVSAANRFNTTPQEINVAELLFIRKFSPTYNRAPLDPDTVAYNEKRIILRKCLSNIFKDYKSNIVKRNAIGQFIYDRFNKIWKTFTCKGILHDFETKQEKKQGGRRRSTRKMKRRH